MATKPPMPPARPASAASAPEDAATRRIRMIAEDREKRAAMGRSYDAAAKNSMNPDGGMKHGGKVKKYAKGGSVTRGDGCAQRGKTKGTMITMMKGGQC